MHQELKIQHREPKNLNTHIWLTNRRVGNVELQHCYRVGHAVWTFSTGNRRVWIHISALQIVELGTLRSSIVTGWGMRRSWPRWHQFWSRLSAVVGWRCTCSCASPGCLQILCHAMLERKASGRGVLTNYSRVSFYHGLHLFMPSKLNTPLIPFWDFGARFLNQILHVSYCGTRKPSFGHDGHSEWQAHVGLFLLYPTSMSCHSSRHVEYLQEICCCL